MAKVWRVKNISTGEINYTSMKDRNMAPVVATVTLLFWRNTRKRTIAAKARIYIGRRPNWCKAKNHLNHSDVEEMPHAISASRC